MAREFGESIVAEECASSSKPWKWHVVDLISGSLGFGTMEWNFIL